MTKFNFKTLIVGRFDPEIMLKGKYVRRQMQAAVVKNLNQRFKHINLKAKASLDWDKFKVTLADGDKSDANRIISQVVSQTFGVGKIFIGHSLTLTNPKDLEVAFLEYWRLRVKGKTYGVRVKLINNLNYQRSALEAHLGGLLNKIGKKVDLSQPQVWVRVWIDKDQIYFIDKEIKAVGGYPLGFNQQAMVLFSGGIDSPVASWLMARKGLKLDFFLLAQGGRHQIDQVKSVLEVFYKDWLYPTKSYFYTIDDMSLLAVIKTKIEPRWHSLVFKYILYLTAMWLGRQLEIDLFITGESLNQVSSQTPTNLLALNKVSQTALIFQSDWSSILNQSSFFLRPLIGLTKAKIKEKAKQIGSLSISEQVFEYCGVCRQPSVTQVSIDQFNQQIKLIDKDLLALFKLLKYNKIALG